VLYKPFGQSRQLVKRRKVKRVYISIDDKNRKISGKNIRISGTSPLPLAFPQRHQQIYILASLFSDA
jgi:hypothetical protein